MAALFIDFETRGVLDLREVGLHRYARDKDTSIWCMSSAIGDAEPGVFVPGSLASYPQNGALDHVEAGKPVYAHNAPFELEIWNNICVPRYGWPALKPEQVYCTEAMCYAMGLPGSLENAALALGMHVLKDHEGRNLMLRMARPRSKPGQPLVWWEEPEKLARLYEYCRQDVRVERELHKRLMPLSDKERKVWLLDYKINQRGVQVDVESAKAAVKLASAMKERYDNDMGQATAGAATTCTALGPIKEYLAAHGVPSALDGLAKQDVIDALERDDLSPEARAVLTLRQEAGKASAAKFNVMADRVGADGRLRQLYQYHGAATGRWAARGVQVHNLPRQMPKPAVVEKILDLIRRGEHDAIDMLYGSPLTAASSCLRSFFAAPPGKVLVSGDFSNVESRGAAWFANEGWKLEAFRRQDDKTGPEVYYLGASRLLGVPIEAVTPDQRQSHGKVPDLAFQYQGGVGSGKTMGKTYGVKATDEEWADRRDKWRAAHPRIKATWYELQNAAIRAVQQPGETYAAGYTGRQAKFKVVGSFLWCLLISGRALCFPYPKLLEGEYGPQLTFMTVPGPDKAKVIHDKSNANNWARVGTYGGSLLNNVIQAMCRDLLVESMLALDAAGAGIVLHVHDEIVIEVDAAKADGARGGMERLMSCAPAWAAGFPLITKCVAMSRYGKG